MILIALAQALVTILIGVILVKRGRRGWGWTLVGLGGVIVVMAVVGLAAFSP
jgi:hypothetical protein